MDYFSSHPPGEKGVIGLLTSRANRVNGDLAVEKLLIRLLEEKGYCVLPMYTYSWREPNLGAEGPAWTLEQFAFDSAGNPLIGGLIKMTGFFLGGRGKEGGEQGRSLLRKLNGPVFKPICSVNMSVEEWEEDPDGTIKDVAWGIALPELEGVLEPLFIGGGKRDSGPDLRCPVESRCRKLADRIDRWMILRNKPNQEKKVVFILNNNPCASVEATVGGGAKLDTLESVARILQAMQREGYDLDHVPADGEELIRSIMDKKAISEFRWTTIEEIVKKGGVLCELPVEEYLPWFQELPEEARAAMTETWGNPPGEEKNGMPPAMLHDGKICITGVSYKNALVCVQPKRGCAGSRCDGVVCKILHDPHVPPTHQYFATYRYFERIFQADMIIHVGTHGNLEFLPGKGTGLSDGCFPDICIGKLPNLYLYNADNPPEGTIAKRRASACIVDHMQTVYVSGGLYDDLEQLDQLVEQYERMRRIDASQSHLLQHQILEQLSQAKLASQIDMRDAHQRFDEILEQIHRLLTLIRNTQIADGMHIFGEIPQGEKRVDFLYAILHYEGLGQPSIRSMLCRLLGLSFPELLASPEAFHPARQKSNGKILEELERPAKDIIRRFLSGTALDLDLDGLEEGSVKAPGCLSELESLRERVLDINRRIEASTERENLFSAMNGEFVPPGPAGVVTRGRDDVLPTGRNFYTLDPETVPTKAAWMVGQRLADTVIQKFQADEGRYPESFGMYWMTNDLMWADGEGMAQLLSLIGVRPRWQSNGKVKGFEVISLEELGRPRIDLSVKVSGILRDNFQDRMELLDEAIGAVARLDEPAEKNYIRKHTLENQKEYGMSTEEASVRIFGSRPGTYLNGTSLQVYASAWKERGEMVDVFTFFNGYSYGQGSYGKEAYRALQSSLKQIDITYNKVMSDEHDLLGCCCYFGVQGGMTAAARELSGKEVKAYYGDTREVNRVEVRTMAEEMRRVVQSKLLNPKWIEGQKRHGYKGAGDISKRIGRVYGWEATTDEVDDWIFDEITHTYIENPENFQFFKEHNPWAMEEISRRLMEAYQRKLWNPEDGVIENLKESYMELEGWLEENMGDGAGDFQGGAVETYEIKELDSMKEGLAHMRKLLGDG